MKIVCNLLIMMSILTCRCGLYADVYNNIPYIRPIRPSQDASFSWVHEGALFYVGLGEKGSGYLYHMEGGGIMVVSNDIDKASIMLQNEFRRPEEVRPFLEKLAVQVFLSLFGTDSSYIISSHYIENWNKYINSPRYGYSADALLESSKVLTKYVSDDKPTINNGNWGLEIYVVLVDGGIEKWILAGRVFPLRIDSLCKLPVEKRSTIVPIPEVGGAIRYREEEPPLYEPGTIRDEPTGQPTHD